ncbi:MAG TPA: ribosome biogenesis GTPase YlqF [Ruminococcaceae bacterium]|nr:ribosome biogenesis GTPase YlqF [Oscillospiraceae bacterium]
MNDSQKQVVQWFPGHMAKTRRQIKESLPMVDAVTELLDARVPMSSRNPELDELTGSKPRIVLLNKCDMADEKATAQWLEWFASQGVAAMAVDCRSGKGLQGYHALVRRVLAQRIRLNEEKGMPGKPLRIMVVGIPNTGKSSFINRCAGFGKAQVADKPGVTRSNKWFVIGNGIELLDTPGVLWPKFEDPTVGDRLSFIGSVKDEVVDCETMAIRLLEVLARDYRQPLMQRYKLDSIDGLESYEVLEKIGRKRGMLISGGEIDTERASIMLLDEYRAGKLGRITLERPCDYA